jgi:hypothetical protein
VIAHPAFREGLVSTRFLADHEVDLRQPSPEAVPLIAAALAAQPAQRPTANGQRRTTDIWDSLGNWGR